MGNFLVTLFLHLLLKRSLEINLTLKLHKPWLNAGLLNINTVKPVLCGNAGINPRGKTESLLNRVSD